MNTFKDAAKKLSKTHPHSAELLKAFTPLLQQQYAFAEEFSEGVTLPPLDKLAFAQGKPWLSANDIPFTQKQLIKAAKKYCSIAAKQFAELKEDCKELSVLLTKNPTCAEELLGFRLQKNTKKIADWAKKHKVNAHAATLIATQLGATFARSAELASKTLVLPEWKKAHCPICGGAPYGSVLEQKEGYRSLLCSLCGHKWRFSRTTCPACDENTLEQLPVYTAEPFEDERAEGCLTCKRYILGLDTRAHAETLPMELRFLCMMPMDMYMQEHNFLPIEE